VAAPQEDEEARASSSSIRPVLVLSGLAVIAGAAVGLLGGAFRWVLEWAQQLMLGLVAFSRDVPAGWLLPIAVTAVCTAAAAWIVRLVPLAGGSGIPHVEAVQRGEASPPGFAVIPARFVGGVLAIGSGLVLGREGPTVHMGASIGATAARLARLGIDGQRDLQTAMGGAGLAVAFNAPLGGAIFVLEEVAKSVRLRIVIPTIIGVASAITVARLIIGGAPDFLVGHVDVPSAATLPLFALLGILVGVIGAGYARAIVFGVSLPGWIRRVPVIARAGIIGAMIGAVLVLQPLAVGDGDPLAQLILAGGALGLPLLLLLLLLRFVTGPLSYAAGTPGGLFAPLLGLGAVVGSVFAIVAQAVIPGLEPGFGVAAALVGMTSMFAAVVRAPITGIVLVIEMTAVTTAAGPMLLAGAAAVLVAWLLRVPPVYDTLRQRMLGAGGAKV
jgi:CIC family chloride channel protein